jgi:hypothetical protein
VRLSPECWTLDFVCEMHTQRNGEIFDDAFARAVSLAGWLAGLARTTTIREVVRGACGLTRAEI